MPETKVIVDILIQHITLQLAKKLQAAGELKAAQILLDTQPDQI